MHCSSRKKASLICIMIKPPKQMHKWIMETELYIGPYVSICSLHFINMDKLQMVLYAVSKREI